MTNLYLRSCYCRSRIYLCILCSTTLLVRTVDSSEQTSDSVIHHFVRCTDTISAVSRCLLTKSSLWPPRREVHSRVQTEVSQNLFLVPMMPVYTIFEWICAMMSVIEGLTGMILNGFLLYCILKKSPPILKVEFLFCNFRYRSTPFFSSIRPSPTSSFPRLVGWPAPGY